MSREQTIIDTSGYLLGLYGTTQRLALATLPRQKLTDREKMAGLVRQVTNTVANDVGRAAVQASNEVYSELRREAGIVGDFTADSPASPVSTEDIDGVVGDFIKRSYGEGALTDPSYKNEISWVKDQVIDAAFDNWIFSVEKVVGDIFRRNMAGNVARDVQAIGYQRVARPNACTFCRVVALNLYTSFEQDGGYHKNCACYAVPVFKGQSPYFPEYYEEFERQYEEYKDAPLPEGYQTRALKADGKAEIRRRETFRNIRANIEAETRDFPIPAPPLEPTLREIEPGKFTLGGDVYDMPVREVTRMSNGFNDSEIAGLNTYTNMSFSIINGELRAGRVPDVVANIDSALSKSITTQRVDVIRGTSLDALLPRELPGLGRTSQLQYINPTVITDELRKLEGAVISDPGFLSTSIVGDVNPDIAAMTYGTRGLVFEIDIPPGTNAIDIYGSNLPNNATPTVLEREQEMLLPRGTSLRINEIIQPGGHDSTGSVMADMLRNQSWTIMAEVVND